MLTLNFGVAYNAIFLCYSMPTVVVWIADKTMTLRFVVLAMVVGVALWATTF